MLSGHGHATGVLSRSCLPAQRGKVDLGKGKGSQVLSLPAVPVDVKRREMRREERDEKPRYPLIFTEVRAGRAKSTNNCERSDGGE